jgi:hypothetical protein
MKVVKRLSLIFLAIFLIFHALAGFFGFNFPVAVNFLLGLIAAGAGILMLIAIREYCCWED